VRLLQEGNRIDIKLPLDEQKLAELCKTGRAGKWGPLTTPYPESMRAEMQKEPDESVFTPETHLRYARSSLLESPSRPSLLALAAMLTYAPTWPLVHQLTPSRYTEYMYAPVDSERPDLMPLYKRSSGTEMPEQYAKRALRVNTGAGLTHQRNPVVEQNAGEMGIEFTPISSGSAEEGERQANDGCLLRGVDRLKLIRSIVTTKMPGCCGIDVEELLRDKCIYAFFPLHDYVELLSIQRDTMTVFQWPWNFPLDRIKDYFGEKIGLYFLFLTFYCTFCIPAGIMGFIIWITYATDGNSSDSVSTPYYAAFVGLWATLFLEFWQKKERRAAMRWGMIGFEEEETDRPAFEGDLKPSPVTGKQVRTFSGVERAKRTAKTTCISSVLSMAIIAAACAIFVTQKIMFYLNNQSGSTNIAPIVAAVWYSVQIEIFTYIFSATAINLTDYENHRTDTEYEDALIAKSFLFQFVNCYTPLFYIAFLKPFIPTIDYCTGGDCMAELQVFLGTIFLARLVLSNLLEVAIPAYHVSAHRAEQERHVRKERATGVLSAKDLAALSTEGLLSGRRDDELRDELTRMGDVEKNFVLNDYNVMLGVFDDYSELVIQFGYTTMFVAAFPLCVIIAAVSNYVEIRVDSWKLSQLTRRPEPRGTEDIGTWFSVLSFISCVAVVTNSAISVYTATQTIDYTWSERSYLFIGITGIIFTAKAVLSYIIYLVYVTIWLDTDTVVDVQIARQAYIEKKVVLNFKDDADFNPGKAPLLPHYTIGQTDDDPL
jgi:anoctamin-10/anoctamin-7